MSSTPTPKFKVGDKVRRVTELDTFWDWHRPLGADVHEVVGVQETTISLKNSRPDTSTFMGAYFELVSPAASKRTIKDAKPGDKVRFISAYHSGSSFTVGKIYTCSGNRPNGYGAHACISVALDDRGSTSNGWSAEYFELVEGADESFESDEVLLEILNKGLKARVELVKRHGIKLEFSKNGSPWRAAESSALIEHRIKPKPSFEPMQVGEWRASIAQGKLVIGCQEFEVGPTMKALHDLVRGEAASSGEFKSARKGVRFKSYTLAWDDADKLLTALQKAFKE